jgi:pyruvate/2-oxoglutarate dehydrogenase complex dihydrolipoamide dehydrogenase (E3) component
LHVKRRVVVVGAGSAGEHFVGALRRLDDEVEIVAIERELAGEECSYYACLPTKTLLRPVEALSGARLAPGAAEAASGEIDVERVWWWRDQVTDGRHDSWHADWLRAQGAELVRGEATVARPGVVAVGDRELEYDELVVATGSAPAIPPIEGLDEVEYWTSRDAVWASWVPESLVVLGGGPVGVELCLRPVLACIDDVEDAVRRPSEARLGEVDDSPGEARPCTLRASARRRSQGEQGKGRDGGGQPSRHRDERSPPCIF